MRASRPAGGTSRMSRAETICRPASGGKANSGSRWPFRRGSNRGLPIDRATNRFRFAPVPSAGQGGTACRQGKIVEAVPPPGRRPLRKRGQAPFAGTARPTFGRCPVLRTKGACPLFVAFSVGCRNRRNLEQPRTRQQSQRTRRQRRDGKGDRHLLPERPFGCCAQKVPVPFSFASAPPSGSEPRVFSPRQFRLGLGPQPHADHGLASQPAAEPFYQRGQVARSPPGELAAVEIEQARLPPRLQRRRLRGRQGNCRHRQHDPQAIQR